MESQDHVLIIGPRVKIEVVFDVSTGKKFGVTFKDLAKVPFNLIAVGGGDNKTNTGMF